MLQALKNVISEACRLLACWFIVWFIVACLIRSLVPDPATQVAGPLTDAATRKLFTEEFGLDRPLAVESVHRAYQMLHGDWGVSWRTRLPVTEVVAGPTSLSVGLALAATMVSLTLSLIVIAAKSFHQRIHSWARWLFSSSTICLFLAALPAFITALWLSNSELPGMLGLPRQGFRSAGVPLWEALLLPSFCLALPGIGLALPRLLAVRSNIVSSGWYRSARSVGQSPRYTLLVQGWPFFAAALGDAFAQVFLSSVTAAVAVEYVFSLPGLGTLLVDSVQLGDVPVLLGVVAITTILTFSALAIRTTCMYALPSGLRPTSTFQ